MMHNTAVLGNFFGDEGKGRIVHYLSRHYDWVIRFSGGSNAGHTIYRDGKKYVHNLLPSFDWRIPTSKCFLGSGMVIDLDQLHKEVITLEESVPLNFGEEYGRFAKRIYVDPDAFVVLPEHKEEDKQTNAHIGSTNRGIGPAYKSKILRKGIRIKELLINNSNITEILQRLGIQFKHVLELGNEFENQNLLFEGAQGVLIDLNHGTYPYVSCGDSTVAGIYSSGFAQFAKLEKVYGVAKCYSTRVGEGPFPTEIFGDEAEVLRKLGDEYGATTGRPRRIGWLDLPAMEYACKKGGITHLVITKFDILNGLDEVKICVAYKNFPVCPTDFFTAQTQLISIPGWKNAEDINSLKPMINYIERFTNCPVEYISRGIKDNDIVRL